MARDIGDELLLAAFRIGDESARVERFGSAAPDDWLKLLRSSENHQVTSLLGKRLRDAGVAVPPDIAEKLRTSYHTVTARNIRLYHYVAPVLERLRRAGIPVIPLKGIYFAEHIYESIGLRSMCDVDLLVREKDLGRTDKIVSELGYRRPGKLDEPTDEVHHLGYAHTEHRTYLEVHWALTPPAEGIVTDIDSLWERSKESSLGGTPVREMTVEDRVLHLFVHASNHLFETGLREVCDLAEILRRRGSQLDWDVLLERAGLWGAERCVAVNMRLAAELLNLPVPVERQDLGQDENFETRFAFSKECLFAGAEGCVAAMPGADNLLEMWRETSLSGKISLIRRRIFVSRKHMAAMYPVHQRSRLLWLYYPLRIWDLLMRYGKTALQLTAGKQPTVLKEQRQQRLQELRKWLFYRRKSF